jgi:hypothetical protein
MRKKITLIVGMLLLALATFAQQKITLSGYIKEAKSGEALIGATIAASGKGFGKMPPSFLRT